MERIIFLDVDGVLHNKFSMKQAFNKIHPPGEFGQVFTVDPACVFLLKNVVEKHNLKLVISATCRSHPNELKTALAWAGWDSPPIIGYIDHGYDGHRGREIGRWIEANKTLINSFVVLDDSLGDSDYDDRLVQPDFDLGLTESDVLKIEMLFGQMENTND